MKKLKSMMEDLVKETWCQVQDLPNASPYELGQAVDMIKDLAEAIYYNTIVEAMEEGEGEEKYQRHPEMWSYSSHSGTSEEAEEREEHTGKSHWQRAAYMKARKAHTDKTVHMKELEKYIADLNTDLSEMISGASPEEKQLLQRKLTMLANKVTDG